jgi:hypothetical protein
MVANVLNGFDPAMTRRIAQDEQMVRRVRGAIASAARDVHERRVQEWAASSAGEFPTYEESVRIATSEVATLCRALGTLVTITPSDVNDAYLALQRVRRWG